MSQPDGKQPKAWIRSQHLICEGTDFIFETVDQTQLEKFEHCIELIGGRVRKIAAAELADGTSAHLQNLARHCRGAEAGGEALVTYWAKRKQPHALCGDQLTAVSRRTN